MPVERTGRHLPDGSALGALRRAPENFVAPDLISAVTTSGLDDTRRSFLRSSFAAALLGAGGFGQRAIAADGEAVILEKQSWQTVKHCHYTTNYI